jgi:hypothetical protein
MDTLSIAAIPHLIPAPTIPNGEVQLAISAPLASGRDEVIYLVCTHERIRFAVAKHNERVPVLRASSELGGGILWDTREVWAWVTLRDNARPSAVPWAIIDVDSGEPASIEQPNADDPDGVDGRHREELLPWIYDRHLELARPQDERRGEVEGGEIEFRLEYIGKRRRDALRRPAGAHHRVAQILARTLLYEPHRLLYMLPCDIRVARHDSSTTAPVKAEQLDTAAKMTGIPRALLSAVAEEALIAWLGPPYNVQNTGPRKFPHSASGERLTAHGVSNVNIAIAQLPGRVSVRGDAALADSANTAHRFTLTGRKRAPRCASLQRDAPDPNEAEEFAAASGLSTPVLPTTVPTKQKTAPYAAFLGVPKTTDL